MPRHQVPGRFASDIGGEQEVCLLTLAEPKPGQLNRYVRLWSGVHLGVHVFC
jgi:hypothetical protein